MKKIICLFLVFSLALSFISSCSKEDDASNNAPESFGTDISDYTIIRSENADTDLVKYVSVFKNKLIEYIGADIPVLSDGVESRGEKEILIGDTSRAESALVKNALKNAPENAYTIRSTENKIIISAKSDDGVIRAMKHFLMTYVKESGAKNCISLESGKTDNGTINLNSVIFDDLTELSVDFRGDLYNPTRVIGLSAAYETLVQLNCNGDKNGTLLATFATYSVGYGLADGYNIYESTDNGKSWQVISTVRDTLNPGMSDNLQPHLFELPRDMGVFKAGTVFLSACAQSAEKSKITLYYSTDTGKTWTQLPNIAEGGAAGYGADTENPNAFRGVWEPFLIYEESTNRLYCFYSDETLPKEGHKTQKMAYVYTDDLVNWSEKNYVANCANLRAGMMSITKMGNGEYFGVYMTGEIAGAPLHYKTTDRLDEWGDPYDIGTRLASVDGKSAGQAPWCTWTPAGGECGTLIVVGKYMVGDTMSVSDLFLSFDYGKTFVTIDNPIQYKQISDGRCSYSAFLGTASDGTVFYLNNPSINDTQCKVVFTRIKIW